MNSLALAIRPPQPVEGMRYVYILLCAGNHFYVGSAIDVAERFWEHCAGKGARQTRIYPPLRIAYVEGPFDPELAIRRESQLKRWSRAKKEALVRCDRDTLRRLSRSRD